MTLVDATILEVPAVLCVRALSSRITGSLDSKRIASGRQAQDVL